jgi:NADPH:quinone reductase-like Zn-dependent oxidoreductase
MGLYPGAPQFPAVVGYEVAGTVEKLGSGVTSFAPGDRVFAMTKFGGYSEKVFLPAGAVFAIPDELTFEKAAAIPVNYLTAWLLLIHLGNVRRGEKVLVHAAAGGVGQAAVQICRWRGAEVIGTASSAKHERLRDTGVSHTIDYYTQDFEAEVHRVTAGKGVDIVLDAVGGKSALKSYRSLAPLGRLFLFGASSFAPGTRRSLFAMLKGLFATPSFKPLRMIPENKGVFGVHVGYLSKRADLLRETLAEILRLVAAGTLDPQVDRTFPLEEASQAHAYIQAHKNFGKVLLVP